MGSISCAEAGVLGVLPGTVGTLQATEIIKLITGIGTPLIGSLLIYDVMNMSFNRFKTKKNESCDLCGKVPSIREVKEIQWACQTISSQTIQADELGNFGIPGQDVLILDVRNEDEVSKGSIPNHLHIPLPELSERIQMIDEWKERPLICYCQSGIRSLKAIESLEALGFKQLYQVEGGYLSYLKTEG